jgi:RND superfamily putative drug exporter
VIIFVLAILSIAKVGTEMQNGGGVGDSGRADELLVERFEVDPLPGAVVVHARIERIIVSNPSLDVDDPAFQAIVDPLARTIQGFPLVTTVLNYYDDSDTDLRADDRNAVLIVARSEDPTVSHNGDIDVQPIMDAVDRANTSAPGFEVGIISSRIIEDEFEDIIEKDFQRILLVSMFFGLGVLILAFRAVVAALIPLVMAIVAIFTALGIVAVISQKYAFAESYAEVLLLMGLAVGIDYSLFVISRFRHERTAGRPKLEAIAVASNTTGRAVVYAGITVILSLTGLVLTRDATFTSFSVAAVIVVALAVVGSLTLLPALLSILGDRVNWLRIPFLGRESQGAGIWGAIADRVLAKPAILATLTAAALLALALPLFSMNIGFNQGADAMPDALKSKRAIQLLEQHFSSSLVTPAKVVIDAPDVTAPGVQSAVDALIAQVGQSEAFLGPFGIAISRDNTLLRINVRTAGKLDDDIAEGAIDLLRDVVVPQTFSGVNAEVFVGGDTAGGIDFRDHMFTSAPFVFVFVLGLSFLLLMLMFRSLVIAIKAITLNLMSVAAVYGVLVMVFQWGWGISLLGSEETGIIEAWLPLLLFGILFGLSMDYHMLLLNRIKEFHDGGATNEESVSQGIRITAGQITSAAIIMVGVFGAFATSRVLGLQQFGLGLGVAVLIVATVIRVVLLPATMKLLGEWNWYMPSWLDWLPKITQEESHPLLTPPASQAQPD